LAFASAVVGRENDDRARGVEAKAAAEDDGDDDGDGDDSRGDDGVAPAPKAAAAERG
jgi:hypothetical protein